MTPVSPGYLFCGLVAVLTGSLAAYQHDWPPFARVLLAGVALVFGVVFVFFVLDLLVYLYGRAVSATRYPDIRRMELLKLLNETQLRALMGGYVTVTGIPSQAGIIWRYQAPGMTDGLTPEQVKKWADLCSTSPDWPDMPPQHGMNDNAERGELRAFTRIAVALGLAEDAVGPLPAKWKVNRRTMYERLEV